MITIYNSVSKELVKNTDNISVETIKKAHWIDLLAPTKEEISLVYEATGLKQPFLYNAIDEEESAHVDVDEDETYIVLDQPVIEVEDNNKIYTTMPFSMIYNEKYFVTVRMKDNSLIPSLLAKNKNPEIKKHVRFSLLIMYKLASLFITCLKVIDNQTKDVERELHNSMKNKELFELMDLNKTLVYFSTALNANKAVIARLIRMNEYKKYEDDYDLIEDTQIELNQASEMCSIYRDILSGTMDAFASIISNNLNIVMKVLAVVTIVLSVPTVIASFFGMNVANMPLGDSQWGFWIIAAVSLVCSLISAIVLIAYSRNVKHK